MPSQYMQQAPNMMQNIAPDLAAEQVAMQRRQQIADMLRQNAMAQDGGTQMVGGYAIPQGIGPALAKALQGLAGAYMQKQNDDKGLEIGKAMQGRMSDSFDQMSGNVPAAGASAPGYKPLDVAGNAPPATYQAGGSVIGSDPEAQQSFPVSQPTTQQAQSDPATNLRKMAKMAYMLSNQELSNKYLENANLMTEGQRNDRYMGISGQEAGVMERAKRNKEGTMSFAPGQTNILPGGKRIVAADFNAGTQGGYDAQGNPTIAEIPGSTGLAAARAGQIASAQEAPKLLPLGYVGKDDRPIGGTIGQYTGSQQQGQQAPMNLGLQSRLDLLNSIKDPEQRQSLINTVYKNIEAAPPHMRDVLGQQWSDAVNGRSAQGGQPGQPLQSATEAATAAAKVKLANEPQLNLANKIATDAAEYEKNLNGHVSESQALLERIAQSREALTKFTAGGGGEMRVKLASLAQAMPGVPTALVDRIAGGDLSAAQEFQKYAAQEALGTMQQALASDTGKGAQGNRVAMQLFIKNNPNVDTDPRAIEKIFNFQTGLHNKLLDQSNTYQKYKDSGADVGKFPNYWANEEIKRGYVTPEIKTGYAKGLPTQDDIAAEIARRKGSK